MLMRQNDAEISDVVVVQTSIEFLMLTQDIIIVFPE